MTHRQKGLITGVCLIFLSFLVWTENKYAEAFQNCVAQETNHQSTNNANKRRFIIGRLFARQSTCTVDFLDRHAGFVAALAGIAVAWFTLTLKGSTDRLWKAGERALETTERAFIFIDGFNDEITTGADAPTLNIENVPALYRDRLGLYLTRFAVQPRWKNGGNTPTRNMKIRVSWGGFPPLPMPPAYEYQIQAVPFFLGPRATEGSWYIEMPPARSLIDYGAFRQGHETRILIWGRADYEDVFSKSHFVEWCHELRFDMHDGHTLRASFIQTGDYNRTDEDNSRT